MNVDKVRDEVKSQEGKILHFKFNGSRNQIVEFDGKIKICGYYNDKKKKKRSFGYVPETPVLYDVLTVKEHIDFIGNAYRIDNYQKIADYYLDLFELSEKKNRLAKELSKGMKQKLSMLLALMIKPQALLVDEPMVGLDPASIETVLEIFKTLKEQGCAILISTHIIDIINDIYDEAYIMDKGKIINHVCKENLHDETLKEYFFEATDGKQDETVN